MKGKRKKVQHFFVYIAMLVMEKAKQNLTNPDYVEYIARGKYLVTKEGEQVFKFPSKD